jgi:hypothetical protein
MTVKFKDAAAAQACILKNNGRFFDGRKVNPFPSSQHHPTMRANVRSTQDCLPVKKDTRKTTRA